MKNTDVIVLGAGIVGVSVALHWPRASAVTLVDRRGPGEETSYGNAGLIERASVIPYAFPRDLRSLLRYALNNRPDVRYHPASCRAWRPGWRATGGTRRRRGWLGPRGPCCR